MLAASLDKPDVALMVANIKQNPAVVRSLSLNVMPTLLRESDLWVLESTRLGLTLGATPVPLTPVEYLGVLGWPANSSAEDPHNGAEEDPHNAIANVVPMLTSRVIKSLAGNGMNIKVAGAILFYALACSARVDSAGAACGKQP